MTCFGIVRDGRVELEPGASLPDGAKVRVELAEAVDPADAIYEEAVETGISDLAARHDHYAYGTPDAER